MSPLKNLHKLREAAISQRQVDREERGAAERAEAERVAAAAIAKAAAVERAAAAAQAAAAAEAAQAEAEAAQQAKAEQLRANYDSYLIRNKQTYHRLRLLIDGAGPTNEIDRDYRDPDNREIEGQRREVSHSINVPEELLEGLDGSKSVRLVINHPITRSISWQSGPWGQDSGSREAHENPYDMSFGVELYEPNPNSDDNQPLLLASPTSWSRNNTDKDTRHGYSSPVPPEASRALDHINEILDLIDGTALTTHRLGSSAVPAVQPSRPLT